MKLLVMYKTEIEIVFAAPSVCTVGEPSSRLATLAGETVAISHINSIKEILACCVFYGIVPLPFLHRPKGTDFSLMTACNIRWNPFLCIALLYRKIMTKHSWSCLLFSCPVCTDRSATVACTDYRTPCFFRSSNLKRVPRGLRYHL